MSKINQIYSSTKPSFLKLNLNQHGLAIFSLAIIFILILFSLKNPNFLIGESERATHIEIYNGPVTQNMQVNDLINSDKFIVMPKGKTIATSPDNWLRLRVPDHYSKTHQKITLFSTANTNLIEMQSYYVIDKQFEFISSCSLIHEEKECLSPNFKSFLQFSPTQTQEPAQQWIYIHLVKPDQMLYHQFFFRPQTSARDLSESILYFLAFLQGIFFLFCLIGLVFSIPLRDPSLFWFGIFFLGLLVSSQFGRNTPISSGFDPILISHGVVCMMYILLAIKVTLMVFVFDLRKTFKKFFFVLCTLITINLILATFIWIPSLASISFRLQLPMFSVSLLTICSLIFFIFSKRISGSLDMFLAIFIGAFSTALWSLNRGGVFEMTWITDLYSLVGEAIGGIVLLSLIFVRVRDIISERNLVQFRLQESRIAKSLLRALSHDLSNTTQVIISNSHLIEMHSSSGKPVDKFLARIVSSAELQSKIIKHFKNNYMIRGSANVQVTPVFLLHSLKQAIDFYSDAISKKLITVNLECQDTNLAVLAEESSLTFQVFANILGNAVKYSPVKGHITVHVDHLPTKNVIVSFKDQGGGIKPETLSKIFDEHLLISNFEKTEEGTGLGLLIVQDFIKSFGGEIRVENYPEILKPEGTIVKVVLRKVDLDRV